MPSARRLPRRIEVNRRGHAEPRQTLRILDLEPRGKGPRRLIGLRRQFAQAGGEDLF